MNNNIFPCLWFDGNAKNAAEFYCQVFSNSKITTDTPMVVQFEIHGKKIMGLNGGPYFKINPSISLFVTCNSYEELQGIHDRLIEEGSSMFPLDKYPWSDKYAWIVDKFGMTWQLAVGELTTGAQKITTCLLFEGEMCGKAQEALKHYTSIFPNSTTYFLQTYKAGEEQPEGNLKFGHFSLNNEIFAAMDGTGDHKFSFNEGVSLMVEVDTQEEIDDYWAKLTQGGAESRCGWLKDKFGVSWQIVPKVLGSLVTSGENGQKVMAALMKMGKIDIQSLVDASKEPALV